MACKNRNIEMVKLLLSRPEINVNIESKVFIYAV
jgi:hypothetical protein